MSLYLTSHNGGTDVIIKTPSNYVHVQTPHLSFSPLSMNSGIRSMMLTQRISALAQDLARQCHMGSTAQPEDKTLVGKTTKETSHRYSLTRRRKLPVSLGFILSTWLDYVHNSLAVFITSVTAAILCSYSCVTFSETYICLYSRPIFAYELITCFMKLHFGTCCLCSVLSANKLSLIFKKCGQGGGAFSPCV